MAKLRRGIGKNRAFVLIFDQFEEFFFDKDDPQERRQFYEFLGQCIDQPFVKVVLALREDYLHHLLEAETVINAASQMQDQDLLSRDQRYPLANFSPAAAEAVIRQLTHAAQYTIAEDLIHRLVADLAAETGDVRPIEFRWWGHNCSAPTSIPWSSMRRSAIAQAATGAGLPRLRRPRLRPPQ
jgi:hypothetical protein